MPRDAPFTATFLGVKLLDIGLTTVYFFILGIAVAKLFDYIFGIFDKEDYKKHPLYVLFLEIIVHLFCLGVVAYALRNIVRQIPFPLNGVAGYDHFRLKELEGGEVMALILILFQKNLFEKIAYFVDQVVGLHTGKADEAGKGALKGRK